MKTVVPVDIYNTRINELTADRTVLVKQKSLISWGRLAAMIGIGLSLYFLRNISWGAAIGVAVLCLGVFLRLVVTAVNVARKINNLNRLIAINQEEIDFTNGQYFELPSGASFLPHDHPYGNDLDIFGRASVYQYINRTTSQQGNTTLANWLLSPADTSEIIQRQEASKELQPLTAWRQQLQAHGRSETITLSTQEKIKTWLHDESDFFAKPFWKLVRIVGPIVSITIVGLYFADYIETKWFNLYLFVFFLITGFITKKATPVYNMLSKIAPEVAALSASIKHIENQPFQAKWLQQNQHHFIKEDTKASASVKTLNGILSRLDIRLNPVAFLPLNILLFWDLQQMLSFEKWKKRNSKNIVVWFDALGEMEALSSLATIGFNHPNWCYPEIAAEHGTFTATNLGHPLIAANKMVTSSFETNGAGQVAIITGSNMAGKSTFLRSVGLSLVMGMTGGPVCATRAKFARMPLISTMRISDNLEESTSTFYAELKKLKQIIDAVNKKEKIFLLLDEILRGTNSLDRHTGSKALIQQLVKQQAVGIIATHDLELAKLINDHPEHIHNYHFDVQVAGEELFFDYKLKEGVCKSLNASILMKKIGIEM